MIQPAKPKYEYMHPNVQLIHRFYTAFQQKDYITMQSCYANDAVFSDPAFVNLNAAEVKVMWEMLIKKGKDLQVEFENITADDQQGSADWKATYTFSQTGKKVINQIHASFRFREGKIVAHQDHFSFYKWSRQALGAIGWLMGWSTWLQQKVQAGARKNLRIFMESNV